MNPYIEDVKRFLIDTIKNIEGSMGMMHSQAQNDSRQAIAFCQRVLNDAAQPAQCHCEKPTAISKDVCGICGGELHG